MMSVSSAASGAESPMFNELVKKARAEAQVEFLGIPRTRTRTEEVSPASPPTR
jgi:hypothetical protein